MANKVALYIKNDSVQTTIQERLKGKAGQFTTSLLSVVNNNDLLAKCDPASVLTAAMTAASLDLPINQNLGFAYIIPYKDKASFQLGAKGFKQLAQRSGQYKYINDTDVKAGELAKWDRLSGAITFDWCQDSKEREILPIIGYVSYFELLNGFSSTVYMTVEEIKTHAKRYSQAYKNGYGPWVDNFDVMARKTVTKLNISKNGPLSTELQIALEHEIPEDVDPDSQFIDQDLETVKASEDVKQQIIEAHTPVIDHKTNVEQVFGETEDMTPAKKSLQEKFKEYRENKDADTA